MNHSSTDLTRLLDLIERYFDCALTDEEETNLRKLIATTDISHPAVDEARALMGFRRPIPQRASAPAPRRRYAGLRAGLSIAASAAILLSLALYVLLPTSTPQADFKCIAYANGCEITDEDDVLRLIADDIREFNDGAGEAGESFRDELGDIAPIIDNFESNPILPEL